MIQFFTHDEDELKSYEVYKALVEPFRLSVIGFYNNIDIEPNIGLVMKTENVVPFANVIQPELFQHIWGKLVQMIELWGADNLLNFMVSVYGVPVTLEVGPAMNIGMVAEIDPADTEESYWVGNNKTPAVTISDTDYIIGKVSSVDYYMIFKKLIGDILSIEQLKILLQHLRPVGERWTVNYRG